MLGSLPTWVEFSGKHVIKMLRSRTASRLLVISVTAACLLACCAVMSFIRAGAVGEGGAGDAGAPRVSIGWQLPSSALRSVAFSHGGRFLSTVNRDGVVSVYAASGAKAYSMAVDSATDALITDSGRYTAVYSRLNPTQTDVTFLDARGKLSWKLETAGAVWSVDGRDTPGGARFAVGTGSGYIYIVDVTDRGEHFRRWRNAGAVVSVALTADAQDVIFSTWQNSTIGRCTIMGARKWTLNADPSRLHYVEALGASGRVLVRAVPNRSGADGAYALMDRSGDLIHRGVLSASKDAKVFVAPSGQFICVGVDELIRHRGKSLREKHAVLMDASGKELCEKGSPFFRASPLLVGPNGYVLLASGRVQLFAMSPSGELQPVAKTPAPLTRWVSSRDGSKMALFCGDGQLYVADISTNDKAAAALP